MFRLFMYVVTIIFFAIRASNYSNTPYERSYYYDNSLLDLIRSYIRRFFAVKKCKKFITKYKKIYTLRNKNLSFIYDEDNMEMTCTERKSHRKTVASWIDQQESLYNSTDNSFKRIFDEICTSFGADTEYNELVCHLGFYFNIKVSDSKKENSKKSSQGDFLYVDDYLNKTKNYNSQYKKPEEKIDINNADEEKIAKLPGINIVTAKKIIQYRELHNGFKSVEEFYEVMKIKPHFKKQMENIVAANDFHWEKPVKDNNERVIDL